MPDPLSWLDDEAEHRRSLHLDRHLHPFGPSAPGRIADGPTELIHFGSNDYLGLASDPRVIRVAVVAAETYGWGAAASPLVAGCRDIHAALAADLARFEGTESAALFPTGFAANAGTIAALVGPGDAVYLDRLDHACLVAGAKLSGAKLRVYSHNDTESLIATLARERPRFRRVLIATDGVFSMDGDLAPLPALADIADRFDAMLMVDEAHGTGVFGPDGRGASSACGVADRVPIRVGTLSKALGSIGGFVVGSRVLIDHLLHRAPTLIYSTALPPAAASAARAALAIAASEPALRERAMALGRQVREGLRELGYDTGTSSGPIIPVLIGDPSKVLALSARLRARALFIPAIRPPTVPRGTARLRISVTAAHGDDDITSLLEALRP